MSSVPLVSVIVPTRSRPQTAKRCVDSILASDYPKIEVIVVDDDSPEESFRELSQSFPKVKFILNKSRMLLAATRNAGIRASSGEFLFLVDDDNVVDKSAISELVAGAERTSGGVVSPLIFYYSQPKTVWYAGSWMSPVSGLMVFPYRGSTDIVLSGPHQTAHFHDAFMIRRSVVGEVGEFDSFNFPIYLSEADFAERMARKGVRAFVIPTARVWHDVPVLGGGRNLLRNMHITEPRRAYYVARNRIIYVKKYRSLRQRFLFLTFFVPAIGLLHLALILGSRNVKKIHFVRYYLGGIIAGLRAR